MDENGESSQREARRHGADDAPASEGGAPASEGALDLEGAQARAFLAAIVDSSDDAIVGKTLDGVIRSWNAAAERLFGYTAAEAVGRSITLIIPEERLQEETEILSRLRRGERIEHFETERVARDGSRLRVSLSVSPIRGDSGAIVGASKIARDISAQRQMQRFRDQAERDLLDSEQRFRSLADNIAQLAWMADGSGSVSWYNRRWFEYTGTTLEEVRGSGWRKVHHPDHLQRVAESFRSHIEAGEAWEDTFPLRRRDGSYRWFLSRAVPIRDGSGVVVRWCGTNTDITDRMQMEQALRDADRRKNEFLAILAHELRNPLAPIRSAVDLLRHAGDDPQQRERLQGILARQTDHLVRLVDDLLDVSRISSGKVELRTTEVTLAEVVRSAVETCRPALDAKGQELTVALPEEPVLLRADPTRLAQVFANLLSNAGKFTPPGGRVRLEAVRDSGAAVVRVIDSGVGMTPEVLAGVFELFVQGGGEDAQHGGLGIGLTLVESLVELHGGTVAAASDGPGEGSTFTVRLPAAAPTEHSPSEAVKAPAAAPGRALRILVADDNVDAADSLRSLLELLGHQAHAVYDGAAAVAIARELQPDVVLLDLGMPEVDGYEAARRLRRQPRGAELTLIAVTGWGQETDRARTSEAGFDHHVVKPADLSALQALLAAVAPAGTRESPGGVTQTPT